MGANMRASVNAALGLTTGPCCVRSWSCPMAENVLGGLPAHPLGCSPHAQNTGEGEAEGGPCHAPSQPKAESTQPSSCQKPSGHLA